MNGSLPRTLAAITKARPGLGRERLDLDLLRVAAHDVNVAVHRHADAAREHVRAGLDELEVQRVVRIEGDRVRGALRTGPTRGALRSGPSGRHARELKIIALLSHCGATKTFPSTKRVVAWW